MQLNFLRGDHTRDEEMQCLTENLLNRDFIKLVNEGS